MRSEEIAKLGEKQEEIQPKPKTAGDELKSLLTNGVAAAGCIIGARILGGILFGDREKKDV